MKGPPSPLRLLRPGTAPRPPWSLSEPLFVERCERCGDCVRSCEQRILRLGRGGFPETDFSLGGCTYCGACLRACNGRALLGEVGQAAGAWHQRAVIGDGCLSAAGVVCRSCGDACDARAIRFRLEPGGVARPELERAACNGCGACVSVCPVQAVTVVVQAAPGWARGA